jgi:hypothetical protein
MVGGPRRSGESIAHRLCREETIMYSKLDEGFPVGTPRSRAVLVLWLAIGGAFVTCAGCATSGPVTVRRDRFNFNEAGAESTKEQILLNIVRLRYGEPIYFIDIGSMLSHYSIDAGGRVSGYKSELDVWNSPTLRALYGMRGEPVPGSHAWDANLAYSDSPTISYTPLTGEEFSRRVMAPIPPATIIYLSQSGWSIDRLLECCVQQINDVGNSPIHEVAQTEAPDAGRFQRLADLLKKAQDAGFLRCSVEAVADQNMTYLVLPPVPPGWEREAKELRGLLDLPGETPGKFRLTSGAVRREPNEIAMQTRSLLAAMYALAQGIDVPSEHVRASQVSSRPSAAEQDSDSQWLCIRHSHLPQVDPFAQVLYNGYWFYIDKSDWSSKRTFALLTYLFSLQSTAQAQMAPVITVPAGR